MKTTCPNCGAPIEFRYDDSFVRVCSHCNNAVLRTDRGVDSLGKVADLTPIDSPIKLFAEGHFGSASFLIVGMAQIRHEAGGLWQEWYAKFDGGKWGWLAEAQGRYYLTFEEAWLAAPSTAAVGEKLHIPLRGKAHEVTVGEMTSGTYVGAVGELPFKLVPNGTFRYADMSDGAGTFATLDFDDGSGPPTLYVGVQVPLSDLKLSGGEDPAVSGAPREQTIKSQRLACPTCNAPVELRSTEAMRVVCSHCNNLLDLTQGALQPLGVLAQRAAPQIPLGTKGTFPEGEMTVIGYVQRSAQVEVAWYPFDEYLLYKPGLGFRWLVQSDGHWNYVQPIATGAVETTVKGCRYDGVSFDRYQQAPLRVDQVLGEFYWQVAQGEQVDSEDCVAAPAMISRETSQSEENWSLSTYMTPREVRLAFNLPDLFLGEPQGIAPNQPDAWRTASGIMSIAFMVLIGVGLVFAMAARDDQKYRHDVTIPPSSAVLATPTASVPSSSATVDQVAECREYRVLLDALNACPIPDVKSTLEQIWTSTQTITDRDTLVMTCQAGIDSVRAMQSDRCRLPDHDAVLAQLAGSAAGRGSGSGSDAGAGSADTTAFFSDPIQIDGGRNIEVSFEAPALDSGWVYVAADLVEEATGTVVSVDGDIEHYAGVEDGESWSEGSRHARDIIGPQHEGTYILRVEGQQGGPTPQTVIVTLKQSVFRGKYLAWAMVILGIPLLLIGLVSWSHEKKRWENSNTGKAPITPVSILVLSIIGIFIGLGYLLKAMAEASSDSDD